MELSPIVQELVDKLESEPAMADALEQAFALAHASGVDEFQELGIHSVDDYLEYLEKTLHWVPTENLSGRKIYRQVSIIHFVLDMPPIRDWQNPIEPGQKAPWMWLSEWLVRFAQEVGKWMDSPASISPETLATFYASPKYHMEEYLVPEGGWKTFNEFFTRRVDPRLRPIAEPDNDNVLVSTADCTFGGQWEIREPHADVTTFNVKGLEWKISQLLEDSEFGAKFAGGTFTHSFISTYDYHHQHAPVSGRVVEAKIIPGMCYLEVVLHPAEGKVKLGAHRYLHHKKSEAIPAEHRVAQHPNLNLENDGAFTHDDIEAPDRAGYQFLQARGLVIIETEEYGLVGILPIGMAHISSVVLHVQKGDIVKKGDDITHCQLGGSDVVMVFEKQAKVKFNQEIGVHYKMGEAVGTLGI